MKRLRILATIFPVLALNGCAVYMGASAVSQAATGKSIPEHAVSTVADADCSLWDMITDNQHHRYYCEVRDASKTYNRTAY